MEWGTTRHPIYVVQVRQHHYPPPQWASLNPIQYNTQEGTQILNLVSMNGIFSLQHSLISPYSPNSPKTHISDTIFGK